ncbi:MAG: type II toxin-antitoxin system MqsR family toxin [Polyangiaceae bacterium]|nr:type II toxin-antitoxin system MqsR family toxin [Polyangiaceae bacterium]
MPRWLPRVLKRMRTLASKGCVRLTYKAEREAVALGLAVDDVSEVVERLTSTDSAGRLASEATGEWMYLFKPAVGELIVCVKIVLRKDCVIVSFHEDEAVDDEET